MRRMAILVASVVMGCASGSPPPEPQAAPQTALPPAAAFAPPPGHHCFHIDGDATASKPAVSFGMCMRTADECQMTQKAFLDSLGQDRDPNAPLRTSPCHTRDRAVCFFVDPAQGPTQNRCGTTAASCDVLKASLEATATGGACVEFPSSRLNLPAVESLAFRMWCFRDGRSTAGSDCQPTQRACEAKATGMAKQGYIDPLPWRDGRLCAEYDRVVCYPQLARAHEQVLHICTPSFEECEARNREAYREQSPDFVVLGGCAVITGNKPW